MREISPLSVLVHIVNHCASSVPLTWDFSPLFLLCETTHTQKKKTNKDPRLLQELKKTLFLGHLIKDTRFDVYCSLNDQRWVSSAVKCTK